MQRNLCAVILAAGLAHVAAPAFGQASIVQGGNAGTAFIQQSGATAPATISQGVLGAGASDNAAYITQIVVRDSVGNEISHEGSSNHAVLQQSLSKIVQATITQQGNGNLASIDQSDVAEGNEFFFNPLPVAVSQVGNGNTAYVTQSHVFDSSAFASQNGNDNEAHITQSHVFDSEAIVNQNGNGNIAYLTQTNLSGYSTRLNQSGDNNYANFYQHDTIRLGGFNTRVFLQQSGTNNSATMDQSGSFETVQLNQSGSNNSLNVTQAGGEDIVITQAGSFNVAYVSQQFSAGFDASIAQSGSGNIATIIQN